MLPQSLSSYVHQSPCVWKTISLDLWLLALLHEEGLGENIPFKTEYSNISHSLYIFSHVLCISSHILPEDVSLMTAKRGTDLRV